MPETNTANVEPELKLLYSPAVDLIVAAESAGPQRPKSETLKANGGINPWRERAQAVATPFEMADLDLLFSPVSTAIFLFYSVFHEGNYEIDQLLGCLESSTTDELLMRFRAMLQIAPEVEDWINVGKIEEFLVNDRARENVPFKDEARQLVALLTRPDQFRRKLVDVLRWFNDRVFQNGAVESRARGEEWIDRIQPRLATERRGLLNRLLNDTYDAVLSKTPRITIFPISGSAISDTWTMLPQDAYVVIDVDHADRMVPPDGEVPPSELRTDELIEALADPKRVALLRLLRRRPYFGREIAAELGISQSTASYHIEKLVGARLARLELSSGRRFYYTINTDGFNDLLNRLRHEFVGQSGEKPMGDGSGSNADADE